MTPLAPEPVRIELKRDRRELEIEFETGETFVLPYEYLRVYSPSAEVRGHAPSEYKLQTGKRNVGILEIEPQGAYAIAIRFDDGHGSGIYTWEWLYELGTQQEQKWRDYLRQLEEAGASRDPD